MRNVLTVFIASPGDVADERSAIRSVVSRINRITARDLNWELDLRGWEDTLPGFARPQDLINPDVDACDVFVGVVHKRWGTPTGKFTSGFEEEYRRAVERRRASHGPEIALFFRRLLPDDTRDPGPQLDSVLAFRNEVKNAREVLYREYSTLAEWEELVFEFLMRRVNSLALTVPTADPATDAPIGWSEDQVLPTRVPLLELLGDPFITGARVEDRWRQVSETGSWSPPAVGLSRGGLFRPVCLDGSTTLVVGGPAAGKSELVRATCLALALVLPPSHLAISLLEVKGNLFHSSFLPPHCSIQPIESRAQRSRFLSELQDDLAYRQRRMIEDGHAAFGDMWSNENRRRVPHRLVVVDELAGLAYNHPDFLQELTETLRVGRGLGVDAILCAQSIQNVGGGVREASTRRIAFRVDEYSNSIDAIGVPDAGDLKTRGRGLCRVGSESPIEFQCATVTDGDLAVALEAISSAAQKVVPLSQEA